MEGLSSSGGEFATARRGLYAEDIEYIRERALRGLTADQIAKQIGRSVIDVRPWMEAALRAAANEAARLAEQAPEAPSAPPPPPPPRPKREARKVLSLWRGIITVPAPPMTMADIAADVADEFGVTVEELVGVLRQRQFVIPRQAAMWRMVKANRWSTPQIGKFFGGRDHTTVLHAVKAHERRMKALEQEAAEDLASWSAIGADAA